LGFGCGRQDGAHFGFGALDMLRRAQAKRAMNIVRKVRTVSAPMYLSLAVFEGIALRVLSSYRVARLSSDFRATLKAPP
jgi:hypothetical protein